MNGIKNRSLTCEYAKERVSIPLSRCDRGLSENPTHLQQPFPPHRHFDNKPNTSPLCSFPNRSTIMTPLQDEARRSRSRSTNWWTSFDFQRMNVDPWWDLEFEWEDERTLKFGRVGGFVVGEKGLGIPQLEVVFADDGFVRDGVST